MPVPEFPTKELAKPYIADWLDNKLIESGMVGSFDSARKDIVAALVEGETVPCFVCGSTTKVYHRHMYASHAAAATILLKLTKARYKEAKRMSAPFDPYFHVESEVIGPGGRRINHNAIQLRHWGLIQEKPMPAPPEKKQHGYYRLTKAGRLYARNKKSFRRKVVQWRGEVICFWGEYAGVLDALGTAFDYKELMRG